MNSNNIKNNDHIFNTNKDNNNDNNKNNNNNINKTYFLGSDAIEMNLVKPLKSLKSTNIAKLSEGKKT